MNIIKERINKFSVKNISAATGLSESTIYRYINETDDEDHKKFLRLLIYLEIDLYEYATSEKKGDD